MYRSLLTALLVFISSVAFAADTEIKITIKDHKFLPAEVNAPADTRLTLIIENQDPTPEEFESHSLKREKIVKGNSTIKIVVGPLKAGAYPFFGEFNEATAQGKLIVK